MKPAFAELLHNPLLWRGDQLARTDDAVSSGFARLDRELPGRGWPKAALIELCADAQGIGEFSLLLPALKRLAQAGEWITLVGAPHIPYAPAFVRRGIDPARVIVVGAEEERDRWWAAEQVLRAGSAGGLVFWPKTSADQRLRRLQLAAQEGEALAFVFTSIARAAQPSPSPLRIRLSLSASRLSVDIFKRRGGVVSGPLLLDVSAQTDQHDGRSCVAAMNKGTDHDYSSHRRTFRNRGLSPMLLPQVANNRGLSPIIWNRALARADEVRRMPGPDPRERISSNERVAGAEAKPKQRSNPIPSRVSPSGLNPGYE